MPRPRQSGDRERTQQQRRLAGAGSDMPQPHGADDAPAVSRDEGQAFGRQAALAQPLRTSCERGLAEGGSSSASRAAMSAGRS